MGVEVVGNPSQYLEALRGDKIQAALRGKQMPTAFIAFCIEAGVLVCRDEALLFEIEKSVGRRLRPKVPPEMNLADPSSLTKSNYSSSAYAELHSQGARKVSSTAGMPVVNTVGGNLPLERNLPTSAMYAQTVKETDAKMAASNVLRKKNFTSSIVHNARKDWCTPELMRALVMDPNYADKLRAAAYPAIVSYCERTFMQDGHTYMVPYITVLDRFSSDGKWVPRKNDKPNEYKGRTAISTTFYLNSKGGIGSMTSSRIYVYDLSDFTSKEAVGRFLKELESIFEKERKSWVNASDRKRFEKENWGTVKAFLEPYATGKKPIGDPKKLMKEFMHEHRLVYGGDTENEFLAIKTGETCYATIRNNVKEVRKYGPDWYKVLDVTACIRDGALQKSLISQEFERQRPGSAARIRAVADESVARLGRKVLSEEGLVLRGTEYVDTRGEDEYLEHDYSV